MSNKVTIIDPNGLAKILNEQHSKKIANFFGKNDTKASMFMTGIIEDVSRNPKLLECEPKSLITSYMMMAQLQFMPSGVSGESYVLPYKSKNGMIAQFQLGYQGLITLFYKAGVRSIYSDIVREGDKFTFINGVVTHEPDVFGDRGEAKGAYVIAQLPSGEKIAKVMGKKELLAHGKKFSKSFNTDYSPWKEANDPELWMWKKTVLKQLAKMLPKNETINLAIAEDNKDSIIGDRMEKAKLEAATMTMGALEAGPEDININEESNENTKDTNQAEPTEGGEGAGTE